MRQLTAIAFLIALAPALFGQDFKQRAALMQQEYANLTKAHIEMDIQVFEAKENDKPYYSQTAIVKRENQNYFYRISGTEMMMNSKYLLMIDETSRQIVCSARSLESEKNFTDPLVNNLDSIMALSQAPAWVGMQGDIEHYSMTLKDGAIKKIELFINASSNTLKRLEYLYEGNQYVTIEFKVFDKAPAFKSKDFDESKYITFEGGKMKTTELYARFQLSFN